MVTEHHSRTWLGAHRKGLSSNGDPTLWADAHGSAEAPDIRPPGTVRNDTESGALLLKSQVPSLLRGHFDFAVEFFGIVVFS